jgi:hypothetical protein
VEAPGDCADPGVDSGTSTVTDVSRRGRRPPPDVAARRRDDRPGRLGGSGLFDSFDRNRP